MDKNIVLALLMLLISPLAGMEPNKPAKRKLFEGDTPLSPVVSPTKGYTTAPDTPATPYKAHVEKLAARNILPIAILNTSDAPVLVTYETAKGQAYKELPPSKQDFSQSRLDAEVSFREPIRIVLNGMPIRRIVFDRENNKLKIQEYRSMGYSPYVTIDERAINLSNPLVIRIKRETQEWIRN